MNGKYLDLSNSSRPSTRFYIQNTGRRQNY